jgi:hypothetical protein
VRHEAGCARRALPRPLICLIVFAVVWTALAVSPRFREDWLLDRRANYAGTTMR